jgi:hypothetical protein
MVLLSSALTTLKWAGYISSLLVSIAGYLLESRWTRGRAYD